MNVVNKDILYVSGACRDQKKVPDCLGLELEPAMSHGAVTRN